MILFVFIPSIFSQFKYFQSFSISSKPAKVEIAGFKHMLGVAEISDSINSFPPHLVIYSVGQTHVGPINSVMSPCYSLGTQLASYQFGFYATAPASAFRWGDPGPLLYKIIPPAFTMQKLSDFPRIPYGESFSTSHKGNLQVLCSPYSTTDCIIINESNITKLKSPSDSIDLFGFGVAVSKNGSIIVTVSRGISNGNAVINFFSNLDSKFFTFEVQHNPPINSRSKPPIIQFLNDKQVGILFPEIDKFIIYRHSSLYGWTSFKTLDISIESFTQIDQTLLALTKNGVVHFYDKISFFKQDEIAVPIQIADGEFTKITSGKDWFAVLEESPNQRFIHVYTSRTSPLLRGIAIFVVFSLVSIIGIAMKENVNISRIMKKLSRKKIQSKYSFKLI